MVGWLLLLPFDNDDRDDYKGYEGWNEENFQHKFLFNILLITPFLCTISLRHVLFDLWISNFYGSLVEKDMNGNWNRLKSVQILSRLLTKQSYYEGEIKCSNINNFCCFFVCVCTCHVYFLCVFWIYYIIIKWLVYRIKKQKKAVFLVF